MTTDVMGCGSGGPELDQILIPGAGDTYETHPLLTLFGFGRGILKSYEGMGHAPLHFITQRSPYQDGEGVLDMRYDTRVVQILIEEALAGRTQYWDRHWDLLDLLRPNRSFGITVRPLIYRKWLPAGKVEQGTDGEFAAGGFALTSHEARFVGRGLDAGASVIVTGTAADNGTYTVTSVPNDYTVVLNPAGGWTNDETNVNWEFRRGWGKRDLYCLLEQGPAFNEGLGPRPPGGGYREALRFVAHDPFWYGKEQSETWALAVLDALVFDTDGTSQVRAWFGANQGIGFWFFGGDAVSESVEVVYWGTVGAKPIFTIAGPAINPLIDNVTIGARIEMDYEVAIGETITIDTLALTVTNNFGENLQPYTTGDLATFELSPPPQAPDRINNIFVSFAGAESGLSAITMTWRTRNVGLTGG